jgi:hypothetical protein
MLFLVSPALAVPSVGQGGGGGQDNGGDDLGSSDDGRLNLTNDVNYTQAAFQNLFTAGGVADDDAVRIISHSEQSMLIEGTFNPGLFLGTNYSQNSGESGYLMSLDENWSSENPAVSVDWLEWSTDSHIQDTVGNNTLIIGTHCYNDDTEFCNSPANLKPGNQGMNDDSWALTIRNTRENINETTWIYHHSSAGNFKVKNVIAMEPNIVLVSGVFVGKLEVTGHAVLNQQNVGGWHGFHAIYNIDQREWTVATAEDFEILAATRTPTSVAGIGNMVYVSTPPDSNPNNLVSSVAIGVIDSEFNFHPMKNLTGSIGQNFNIIATPQSLLISGDHSGITIDDTDIETVGGVDGFLLSIFPSNFNTGWYRSIGSGLDDYMRGVCWLDTGHALFSGSFGDTTLFPQAGQPPLLVTPIEVPDGDDEGDIVVIINRYGEYVNILPTQFTETRCHGFAGGGFLGIFEDDFEFQGHQYSSHGLSDFSVTNLVHDEDLDGYGPAVDAFPSDATQWSDEDWDGYGDNQSVGATTPDACVDEPGTSTEDSFGCPDRDGDGWSNDADAFLNDPTQWLDADFDGYGDNLEGNTPDACPEQSGTSQMGGVYGCLDNDGDMMADEGDPFPFDGTQWHDEDGDNYGDNLFGFNPDFCQEHEGTSYIDVHGCPDADGDGYSDDGDDFPNDPLEFRDTDFDGVGDNSDAFPFNPDQYLDTDGDDFGDNPNGFQGDAFPKDSTQWSDVDGDRCGDNPNGTSGDMFIQDITQCKDADGDGHGDNPLGNSADHFPNDPMYWADGDGDGIPDELDNDRDNDGVNDSDDAFPDNPLWSTDTDGDTIADLVDTDDDGDGFTDSAELSAGTDPLNAGSHPIEGITLFGIEFGVWDIIGILGGGPLAIWLCFGLITRTGRANRYHEEMDNTISQFELEEVAKRYERDLMWRLLGPHQGLRLERIRAERDDAIEQAEEALTSDLL